MLKLHDFCNRAVGSALLDAVEQFTLPTLAVLAIVVTGWLLIRYRKRVHP